MRHASPGLVGSLLALAAVAAPSLAHAQFSLTDEATGLEGSIHLGYGGFSNGGIFDASTRGNLLASFGMQFHLGYRIIPILSAGLHGMYNVQGVQNGGSDTGADAGAFGVYVRVHALSFLQRRTRSYAGTPDLFVGAGIDFFGQVKAWNRSGSIATSGLVYPFQVGFNYALTDLVEVGVLGMVAPWTVSSACVNSNVLPTICSTSPRDAEAYLYIGLGVSGHFNLTH